MQNRPLQSVSASLFSVGEGLSEAEANRRLSLDGANELPNPESRRLVQIAMTVLSEPMVYLLSACGVIYFAIGNASEALMLMAFLVLILVITVYQEGKAERTLETLRAHASPIALVIREGQIMRVASRQLVREDLVVLNEGDRVPADGHLLFSDGLAIDESLLTGESAPVEKSESDEASSAFAGTIVVRGRGVMKVVVTGVHTRMGQIGMVLKGTSREATHLEKQTRDIVKKTAFVGAILCLIVVFVSGFVRGEWLTGTLGGLTLAMAVLPNEIPAVLMIYLSLGAWRIARDRVLARKASAVEALGATTVLCVDKTGTVTMNKMRVQVLSVNGSNLYVEQMSQGRGQLPEEFHELLEFAVLASENASRDPMETAVLNAGGLHLAGTEHLHPDWSLYKAYPITDRILAVSRVWQAPGEGELKVAAKGAPESIIDLCHLTPERAGEVLKQADEIAERGYRVLAVARARAGEERVSMNPHDYEFEFIGLLGLGDPIRAGVRESVLALRRAGVRVYLVTGDHPKTALSVASSIDLPHSNRALTGQDVDRLSDQELAESVQKTSVFCRVRPEQKLRLVNVFKAMGHTVAMTGDGVNDAPALRAAHIGIAMGGRGADVAREAASLVLLDDDFTSIASAIKTGRRIYRNLRQAIAYLLSVHIPIAGLSVLPVIFGLPLILLPIHVAFIHLVIEPACSTVFEEVGGEDELMSEPPRPPNQRLIDRRALGHVFAQGGILLVLLFSIFVIAYVRGQGAEDARALAFTSLVLSSIGLIFANALSVYGTIANSLRENKALKWLVIGTLPMMAIALYVPQIRSLFGFSILHPLDLLICVATGLIAGVGFARWRPTAMRLND